MDTELQQALAAIQAGADPQAVAGRMSSDMHRQALAAVQAGADPQAVSQRLSSAAGGERPSAASDMVRMAAQGFTFGFGDELAGLAGMARGESYTDARDASRKRLDRVRSERPVASTVAEGVGGALLPVGTVANVLRGGARAATAARAAGTATRGQQVARAAGRAAAPSAGYGAVYGLGEAEGDPGEIAGVGDLAREATTGAAYGAAFGGLLGAGAGAFQTRRGRAPRRQEPEGLLGLDEQLDFFGAPAR